MEKTISSNFCLNTYKIAKVPKLTSSTCLCLYLQLEPFSSLLVDQQICPDQPAARNRTSPDGLTDSYLLFWFSYCVSRRGTCLYRVFVIRQQVVETLLLWGRSLGGCCLCASRTLCCRALGGISLPAPGPAFPLVGFLIVAEVF